MEEKIIRPPLKEPVTIDLYYPVKVGQSDQAETISQITLKRPRGKDMRDIPAKPTVGDMMRLAGKISGHAPIVFDLLEIPDWNRVIEAVGDFLADGPKTGETA